MIRPGLPSKLGWLRSAPRAPKSPVAVSLNFNRACSQRAPLVSQASCIPVHQAAVLNPPLFHAAIRQMYFRGSISLLRVQGSEIEREPISPDCPILVQHGNIEAELGFTQNASSYSRSSNSPTIAAFGPKYYTYHGFWDQSLLYHDI